MEVKKRFLDVKQRGNIDYMLRTTQQHHVQLSMMADTKANIILGACFIIITLTFNLIQRTSQINTALLVLTGFAFAAAVCAVIAVMPAMGSHRSKGLSALQGEFNPLFFAHFSHMSREEYLDHMESVLSSDAHVYEAILTDLHQLGNVLYRKKYRFLVLAYRILLAGLALSFITYGIERFL